MTPHSCKSTETIYVMLQHNWAVIPRPNMDTYKASARVTKCWPFICGLMEIMCVTEVVAQFGTYRHSPNEVRGDFFTADLSLPVDRHFHRTTRKLLNGSRLFRSAAYDFMFLSVAFREALVHVFASSPVSFVSAEGEREVGRYFFKVP